MFKEYVNRNEIYGCKKQDSYKISVPNSFLISKELNLVHKRLCFYYNFSTSLEYFCTLYKLLVYELVSF